jgi:hypothetical protein
MCMPTTSRHFSPSLWWSRFIIDGWVLLTTEGALQVGFVVLENAETLIYRGAAERRIERLQADIEECRNQDHLMIPKGSVDSLSAQQLTDLIAYIESLY